LDIDLAARSRDIQELGWSAIDYNDRMADPSVRLKQAPIKQDVRVENVAAAVAVGAISAGTIVAAIEAVKWLLGPPKEQIALGGHTLSHWQISLASSYKLAAGAALFLELHVELVGADAWAVFEANRVELEQLLRNTILREIPEAQQVEVYCGQGSWKAIIQFVNKSGRKIKVECQRVVAAVTAALNSFYQRYPKPIKATIKFGGRVLEEAATRTTTNLLMSFVNRVFKLGPNPGAA